MFVNSTHRARFLSYVYLVDVVTAVAMQLGWGSLLAKIDVKSAYHLIPIHPSDTSFLGMQWNESLYIDCMLPFDLYSCS